MNNGTNGAQVAAAVMNPVAGQQGGMYLPWAMSRVVDACAGR